MKTLLTLLPLALLAPACGLGNQLQPLTVRWSMERDGEPRTCGDGASLGIHHIETIVYDASGTEVKNVDFPCGDYEAVIAVAPGTYDVSLTAYEDVFIGYDYEGSGAGTVTVEDGGAALDVLIVLDD